MGEQFQKTTEETSEIRSAVIEATLPLLDKVSALVNKIDTYHNNDLEFQRNLLLLLSELMRNQQISMEAFDKIDSLIRNEYNWYKKSSIDKSDI